jgi:hypothetical protein
MVAYNTSSDGSRKLFDKWLEKAKAKKIILPVIYSCKTILIYGINASILI